VDVFLSSTPEIVLAEEQGVLFRISAGQEIEGSLVLTSKRLLFVVAKQEEDMQFMGFTKRMRFADVEDLNSIPQDPSNLLVSVDSIVEVKGSSGIVHTPELKVKWMEAGKERGAEFVETLIGSRILGGRKKNINDWAKVIERIKSGQVKLVIPSNLPGRDTLEGRVLYVLSDYQEKGPLEIEEEVEKSFSVDLDPDAVEAACENLRKLGLVTKHHSYGLDSFKRVPPLGPDDALS
jgi:hypothetical protein